MGLEGPSESQPPSTDARRAKPPRSRLPKPPGGRPIVPVSPAISFEAEGLASSVVVDAGHRGRVSFNSGAHHLHPIEVMVEARGLAKAGTLTLGSTNASSSAATYSLSETHSSFDGRTRISLTPLRPSPAAMLSGETRQGEGIMARLERLENEASERFFADRDTRKREARRRRWRAATPFLWENMYRVFKLVTAHRFAPELRNTFAEHAPQLLLSKEDFQRILLDNFPLDVAGRRAVRKHVELLWTALDADLDELVDWRAFLCHLRVLQLPKQSLRKKLAWCFELYRDPSDDCVAVADLWTIAMLAARERDRPAVARLLAPQLQALGLVKPTRSADRGGNDGASRAGARVPRGVFDELLIGGEPGEENEMYMLLLDMVWERTPDKTKLGHIRAAQEVAAARFAVADERLRWTQARMFWDRFIAPGLVRTRWEWWWAYTLHRRRLRKGQRHFVRRSCRLALEQWCIWFDGREERREERSRADAFRRLCDMRFAFKACVVFLEMARAEFEIAVAKAKRLMAAQTYERCWKLWLELAAYNRAVRKAVKFWGASSKSEWFTIWRERTREFKKHRMEEEKRGEMRQKFMEMDLQEELDKVKAEEEAEKARLEAIREAERLAEEQKKREEEWWEKERMKAFEDLDRRKKVREQDQSREKHKRKQDRKKEKEFGRDWDEFLKKAMEDARVEAEQYLQTSEGQQQMLFESNKIQEDAEAMARNKSKGAESQSGSDWVKFYDPLYKDYFFYNQTTGEKVEAKGLTKEETLSIARADYVASQVELAREEVERLRGREGELTKQVEAARKLQAVWKTKKARKVIRDLINLVYVKRVDPHSGNEYYYNTALQRSSWIKPVNLGSYDLKMPDWVVRCDENGQWYYHNRKSPWLSSPQKPPGILPCAVCQLQFATRQCQECMMQYCLDCHERAHPKGSEEYETHTFQRREVGVERCVLCKDRIAAKLCKGCHWDCYCKKCFMQVSLRRTRSSPQQPYVVACFDALSDALLLLTSPRFPNTMHRMTHQNDPKRKDHVFIDI